MGKAIGKTFLKRCHGGADRQQKKTEQHLSITSFKLHLYYAVLIQKKSIGFP